MPRFIVHVRPSVVDDEARASLPRRYPEIDLVAVEPRSDGSEDWVCEAPDTTHLERWVTEQMLGVDLHARWVEPRPTVDRRPRPLTDG